MGRRIQRIEPGVLDSAHHPQEANPRDEGESGKDETTERSDNERSKSTPVVSVQTGLEKEELAAPFGGAEVDSAENEHAEDAAETADDDFEAAVGVSARDEADDEWWDQACGDEVADEVDGEDAGLFRASTTTGTMTKTTRIRTAQIGSLLRNKSLDPDATMDV